MAANAAAAATKRPLKPASTANKAYLIFYNFVSAVLWSVVLGRTVMLLGLHGPEYVYPNVGEFTKWTQTLAGLEVMHSLLGTIYLCLLQIRNTILTYMLCIRRRSRSSLYNTYAGLVPLPPRLGRCRRLPLPRPLAFLLVHADRLVRHRDHPILLLRPHAVRFPAQFSYLVTLQHLLCALPCWYLQRVLAHLVGYRACGPPQ
jgi:hypothetical protein